jgi:hypothetical protein
MSRGLTKDDLSDVDFVDAPELESDGLSSFLTGITVVSTTSSTRRVVFSGVYILNDPAQRIEPDDFIILAGTTGGADGTYTVESVVDDVTLVVAEAIVDSTGGTAAFRWPPGAFRVGFDPTGLSHTTAHTLQEALADLDAEISAGGLTEAQHRILRQLIHFIDDGPAEGFASGAYKEISGGTPVFPTMVTWYESSAKDKKIVEKTINRTGVGSNTKPNPITWKVYETDGVTVKATVIDHIEYNGVFEVSRTRYISFGNLKLIIGGDTVGYSESHQVTVT